jgi:hypothetical protein
VYTDPILTKSVNYWSQHTVPAESLHRNCGTFSFTSSLNKRTDAHCADGVEGRRYRLPGPGSPEGGPGPNYDAYVLSVPVVSLSVDCTN